MNNLRMGRALCAAIAIAPVWSNVHDQTKIFVGWIKRSDCRITYRALSGASIPLTVNQASSHPLFAGDAVLSNGPGETLLLLFGREKKLEPSKWYVVSNDPKAVPPGKAIYDEYTSRAGISRGDDDLPQRVWRATSLLDIMNPNPDSKIAFRLRIVPLNADGTLRSEARQTEKMFNFASGDRIRVELSNDSADPINVSVLDIDFAANVVLLANKSAEKVVTLPPHSGWQEFSDSIYMGVPAGFSGGVEHFRAIATNQIIDLSCLETKDAQPPQDATHRTEDPLSNLIQAAGGLTAEGFTDWSVEGVDFAINSK